MPTSVGPPPQDKAAAGIPMRRPNGMNRYGAILEELGFDALLGRLVDVYVRPMAQMLFPNLVRARGEAQGKAAEEDSASGSRT